MYQLQCHQKPKAGIYALVALWWLVWLWQAAALEATRGGCGRVPAQGVASAPRDTAWSMASPPERPSVGTRSPTGQPVEKHTGKMSFCKINEQPVLGPRCVWAGQPCTWDSAVHCLQRGWAQRGFQRRVRAGGPWCPGWLCLSHAGTELLLSFPLPSRAKPVDKGNS